MSNTTTCESVNVTEVTPELLESWLNNKEAVLVDVREDYEHAQEKIDGAVNRPLSKLDPSALRAEFGDKRVVFHCRSGKRSHDAATRFAHPDETVFHLAGGIEQWKSSGHGVERAPGAPKLPLMRQVLLVAGSMVTLGVVLGVVLNPWFLLIAGFFGVGLTFAGATGWCGLAMLLGKMPWNRVSTPSSASNASCCAT